VIADPQLSYGLILFNAQADYIIPPTFDTWHFLLYLSGLTTNLLPQGHKDFAALTGLLYDSSASYLVLSDFDASDSDIFLPSTVSLIGLWSLAGDKVRYSNGIQYYDHGKSVFSARGDRLAKSFDLPYSVIDTTDALSSERVRSSVANVPLSQRILLYTLLWIVVIIACLL
jgi:hypothetical protein